MSKISAIIVADSINQQGDRITSMLVTFPRFILAELNTHRMLSKNSASSRAIPFKKMVESVTNNPFIPIAWQKEHKGMQGTEYADTAVTNDIKDQWLNARDVAVNKAKMLTQYGVTKQLANRLLEPFMWHTVLITATEWENFFSLRCPQYTFEGDSFSRVYRSKKDALKEGFTPNDEVKNPSILEWLEVNKGQAEIHMMALAEDMWDAMNESIPKELKAGYWHIPFEDKIVQGYINSGTNDRTISKETLVKISTAMSARTSYTIVGDEKEFSYEKQIELHDRMVNQVPRHSSPMEHCAQAQDNSDLFFNLKGFKSYRYFLDKGLSISSF